MKRKSSAIATILIPAAIFLLRPATAEARAPQFSAIVHRIRSHYGKRPVRFMGLLCFVANRVRPAGFQNIRMAVFEDLDTARHPMDANLADFLERMAGPEFRPLVRIQSRGDHEQTFVYARELGKESGILLVAIEPGEAWVIKAQLDPDAMGQWLNEPEQMARNWRGPGNNSSAPWASPNCHPLPDRQFRFRRCPEGA